VTSDRIIENELRVFDSPLLGSHVYKDIGSSDTLNERKEKRKRIRKVTFRN